MNSIEDALDTIVGKLKTIEKGQEDLRNDFGREFKNLREQIDELKRDTALQAGEIVSNKKKSEGFPMMLPVAYTKSSGD